MKTRYKLLFVLAIFLALPPIHEKGHVLIGQFVGWETISVNHWSHVVFVYNQDEAVAFGQWLHDAWEVVQITSMIYVFTFFIVAMLFDGASDSEEVDKTIRVD